MTRPASSRTAPFVKQLTAALQASQMSQKQLAERMGVSQTTVGSWMAGRYLPRADRIHALAELLGLDATTLIAGQRGRRTISTAAPTATSPPGDDLLQRLAKLSPAAVASVEGFANATPELLLILREAQTRYRP